MAQRYLSLGQYCYYVNGLVVSQIRWNMMYLEMTMNNVNNLTDIVPELIQGGIRPFKIKHHTYSSNWFN